MSPNHTISIAEELKKHKYFKWHNVVSYDTNECKAFLKSIQMTIERGKIKFDNALRKTDISSFPTNMVDVSGWTGRSASAPEKAKEVAGLEMQASAEKV